jgi:hypothetical protein
MGGEWAETARTDFCGKQARALFNFERSPLGLSRAGGANSLGGDGDLAK